MSNKETGSLTDDFFEKCHGNKEESSIVLSDFRNRISSIISSDISRNEKLKNILEYVERGVDADNSDDFAFLLRSISNRIKYVNYKEEFKIGLFRVLDEIVIRDCETIKEDEEKIKSIYFLLMHLINSMQEGDEVELFSGRIHELLSNISEKNLDILVSFSKNIKGTNVLHGYKIKNILDKHLKEKKQSN